MSQAPRKARATRLTAVLVLLLAAGLAACGDDGGASGVVGTWVHEEEGTIEFQDGGEGTITQSSAPVPFRWEQEGDQVQLFIGADEEEPGAEATLDGDELSFSSGFSGDEPVVFTRE